MSAAVRALTTPSSEDRPTSRVTLSGTRTSSPPPPTSIVDGPQIPRSNPRAQPEPAPATVRPAQDDEPTNSQTSEPTPAESTDTRSELIDMAAFQQILELDDEEDEDHEFSRTMVEAYFDQVEAKFKEMDKAFEEKNLLELSELGHFLKGSSASLGVSRVRDTCEKMQHYGAQRDEEAGRDLSKEEALKLIEGLLGTVKKDYGEAKKWLEDYLKIA